MKHAALFQHLAVAAVVVSLARSASAQSLDAVMAACAPNVHPTTLSALIRTESGGNPFAISDDGLNGQPWSVRQKTIRSYSASSADEAERIASNLIAQGHIVGIGLTQVNSRNLARFRLSIRDAFDPCQNVRTGGMILAAFYSDALPRYPDSNSALLASLSAFNTGNFRNGIENGYVDKVLRASGMSVPAIRSALPGRSGALAMRAAPVMPLSRKFAVLTATITQ